MAGYEDMFRAAAKAGLIRKKVDARAEANQHAAVLDGIRLQMFGPDDVSGGDAVSQHLRSMPETTGS